MILRVSGRIDGNYISTLWESMEKERPTNCGFAIDLAEVTLMCREAVEVLLLAETNGIELKNCPAYVREWISQEKRRIDQNKARAKE